MSKLAVFGGDPVRAAKMPQRKAFGDEERASLNEAIEFYSVRGEDPPYQGHFERLFCEEFASFLGGGYADAVATGTGAVYVALAALELPRGSEVIISPVTDSGPLNCIVAQGFVPVVADSAPDSYNMGVEQWLDRVTCKTSAVLAVHSAGEPLDLETLVSEAHKRGIKVLEDCSQAPGAIRDGWMAGSRGDVAAFSTMYRKTLMAGGSGGLTFTREEKTYQLLLAHADRGKPVGKGSGSDLKDPSRSLFPALNWNSNELSCAIGRASLKRLPDAVEKRRHFLSRFIEKLVEGSRVCRPYAFHDGFSPFYFPIFVDRNQVACSKTEFAEAVQREGIDLCAHYGCVISAWDWAKPYLSDGFRTPNALSTRDRTFNLFLNEQYGDQEAEDIVRAIQKVEKYFRI